MSRPTIPADDQGDEEALGGGVPYVSDADDDDKDDVMVPDKAKMIMEQWFSTNQPSPVPGVTDSLSNSPSARIRSQLASGHPVTGTPQGVRDDNQVTRPAAFAGLCTAEGSGPLASAIQAMQGRARLQQLDEATVSNASLDGQLRAAPSGNPHVTQGPPRIAPSGVGQTGATPQRPPGPAYLPSAIGGQRQPGFTPAPVRRSPGE